MRGRATIAGVLAGVLVLGAVAPAAQAGRLDDAGRALREPGVWVAADLSWLVTPAQARRLDREIDRAGVPVRVAVLPHLEVDESRGDPRAIVRAIIRRADRDGLYVLVDEEGRVEYAARRLALDVTEFSFPRHSRGFGPAPLRESLAGLVPTLRAAAPASPPTSFEPFASPEGVSRSSGGDDRDPLLGVALACTLLGALGGFVLYWLLRAAVAGAGALRQRA